MPVYSPGNELDTSTQQEGDFVQCLNRGMTIPEISGSLGVNSTSLRDWLAEKMVDDQALEETLGGVVRLPFVAEDTMGKTEAMVYSLRNLGLKRVEVAKILGLDQSNAGKHYKRAEGKALAKKDRKLPDLNFEEGKDSQTLEHIRAIHWGARERLSTFDVVDGVVAGLSINESTTLLWMCTGRTDKQIAAEMKTSPVTVRTYITRASKKLGVNGRIPLITTTLSEIMRDQKKSKPEQSDCFFAQEGV